MVRIACHRIGDPAVMMLGGVQRLARVADKMAHHAHHINNVSLGVGDFCGRAAGFFKRGERGKTRLQFFKIFRDGPRQKSAQLARVVGILRRINRCKTFRMCRPRLRDQRHEIIAQRRQCFRLHVVILQIFQINVVVRPADVAEREVAARFQISHVAPAVGFAREKCDAIAGGRFQNERGKIRRQRREREFVHRVMAFVIPRRCLENRCGKRNQNCWNNIFHKPCRKILA